MKLHNIVEIIISSTFLYLVLLIAQKWNNELIQILNRLLYEECIKYVFCFIGNAAVSERKLKKDGRHVIESGKVILANNFNNCLNNFLSIVDKESNPPKIYLAHH